MSNRKIEKFAKKEKIDKLIGIAEGKNIELAKEAIAALATIKKDESFNHLVVSLRNPNKEIRLAAIRAMGDIGYDRGRTHLAHLIDTDSDNEIVEAAKEASLKLNE
ncbi:MAG: HEAT repeat domain-containing protein [Clostridiales bacterium]|jgi:HEAT repeat protein|nr:HEAT repeat domain-containing protein [Clostridiales bacterium]